MAWFLMRMACIKKASNLMIADKFHLDYVMAEKQHNGLRMSKL